MLDYWKVQCYGERAGVNGMSVRSLPHSHASVTLQSGQRVMVVSEWLGTPT